MRLALLLAFFVASFPTCTRFHSIVLSEADSGTTRQLKRGQEFGVRLKVDPNSGNTWHLVEKSGIVMVTRPVLETTLSSQGTQLWRFRLDGVRPTTLKLEYKRPNAKDSPVAATFLLKLEPETPPRR